MKTTLISTLGCALLLTLLAGSATAETYTITMTNGTTFQSRYDPVEAPWDENKILFLNEYGTHMTLIKDDIESVTAASETNGFGRVIDSTTIDLGILLVDVPKPEEQDSQETQRENFASYLDAANARYSVDQFVDPSQAGAGGLPAWGAVGGTADNF
ncbi:MAG: hypothetical protein K8J08_02435 [Thermoanaerobaculia bacterium]|nr:hypothetical protein [Thermoanaerobaculia bacterium]